MSEWRILSELFLHHHDRLHDLFNWRAKPVWLPPREYLHQINDRPDVWDGKRWRRIDLADAEPLNHWGEPRHGADAAIDIYDEMHARNSPEVKAVAAEIMREQPFVPPVIDNEEDRRKYNKKIDKRMNKLLRKQGFKIERLKLKKRKP